MMRNDSIAHYNESGPFVYVSYSHADRAVVKSTISYLDTRGIRVWCDEGIALGDFWVDLIADKIAQCAAFVIFLSRNSQNSRACMNELNYAMRQRKNIVVVFLEEFEMNTGMRMMISTYQQIKWYVHPDPEILLYELRRFENRPVAQQPVAAPDSPWAGEIQRNRMKEEIRGTTQLLNEMKVVFLGDGEAGKSYTIARLLNDGRDPVNYDDQATPGIAIKKKNYRLGGREIQVNFWDFGGQEILHSMHRIFLTERTLYVVLVNARDETQDTRARYWLHNIRSFARNAPVLLVINKMDQNPKADVNESDLRSKYSNLIRVVKLSALKYSREQFNRDFRDVLLREIQNTGFLDTEWPIHWTKVQKRLEEMDSYLLRGNEYQRICAECGVDANQKDLLHWFNDLGVSFCCCDEDDYELEDYVILKPEWITNALYIILFNECKGANNGMLPHKSIHWLLKNASKNSEIRCVDPKAKYDRAEDVHYVLAVIERFQLAFEGKDKHEFLPMLCRRDACIDSREYEEDPDVLEFCMEFEYLPNNVLHRLMVERQQELDMDAVWLTGARFRQEETGLSAVVVIDGNTLRIFVRHENNLHRPNTYLAVLKANVERIWVRMGLQEPQNQLVYKSHGMRVKFRYERMLNMHNKGIPEDFCDELGEKVRVEDVLNQSAPAAESDQKALLNAVIGACRHLQGNKKYWDWSENERNTVVRDSLRDRGYVVSDQTLTGLSGSGSGTGELDLDIRRIASVPWTICEALIVEGYTKKWNEHLDKLLNNYNPHGLPVLYLLAYVDCGKEKFEEIWSKYWAHIRRDNPAGFSRGFFPVVKELPTGYSYVKAASCRYKKGGYTPTVFFIFARMGE